MTFYSEGNLYLNTTVILCRLTLHLTPTSVTSWDVKENSYNNLERRLQVRPSSVLKSKLAKLLVVKKDGCFRNLVI